MDIPPGGPTVVHEQRSADRERLVDGMSGGKRQTERRVGRFEPVRTRVGDGTERAGLLDLDSLHRRPWVDHRQRRASGGGGEGADGDRALAGSPPRLSLLPRIFFFPHALAQALEELLLLARVERAIQLEHRAPLFGLLGLGAQRGLFLLGQLSGGQLLPGRPLLVVLVVSSVP